MLAQAHSLLGQILLLVDHGCVLDAVDVRFGPRLAVVANVRALRLTDVFLHHVGHEALVPWNVMNSSLFHRCIDCRQPAIAAVAGHVWVCVDATTTDLDVLQALVSVLLGLLPLKHIARSQ